MAPAAKRCNYPGCNLGKDGGQFVTDPYNRSRDEVKQKKKKNLYFDSVPRELLKECINK
jgi:hypothetical protein